MHFEYHVHFEYHTFEYHVSPISNIMKFLFSFIFVYSNQRGARLGTVTFQHHLFRMMGYRDEPIWAFSIEIIYLCMCVCMFEYFDEGYCEGLFASTRLFTKDTSNNDENSTTLSHTHTQIHCISASHATPVNMSHIYNLSDSYNNSPTVLCNCCCWCCRSKSSSMYNFQCKSSTNKSCAARVASSPSRISFQLIVEKVNCLKKKKEAIFSSPFPLSSF